MTRHFTLFLLIAIFSGSCVPTNAVLPSQPTVTATQTIAPPETPSPTQTAITTATLQEQGPYLLLAQDSTLTIMEINGSIRKQIQPPNYAYTTGLKNAISPDGNLFAYFSGTTEEPYDLALNLFNLSDETSQTIANLIAPGFPQNLRPVVEDLTLSDYDPQCTDIECLAVLSSYDFKLGITSFAWSPDGQYLAFTAQIDGPSSDIYLFDRKNQAVRRLTEEFQNIMQIKWSPSGEKILYQATVPGPIDTYVYSYVADPKINLPQSSQANVQYYLAAQLGWIADNSFLYALGPNGLLSDSPRYRSVLSTNLEDNETKEIWSYGAESIALDLTSSKVILSTKGANNSDITAGTYLVSLDGSFTKLSDASYKFFENQEPFKTFLGLDTNSQIYSISSNGDIRLLGPSMGYATPSISPNKKWFLIFENNKKIALYSDNFQLQKSWNFSENIEDNSIKWRSDSLGLIIPANGKTYYLSIPDGEPQLKPDLSYLHGYNYVWLP